MALTPKERLVKRINKAFRESAEEIQDINERNAEEMGAKARRKMVDLLANSIELYVLGELKKLTNKLINQGAYSSVNPTIATNCTISAGQILNDYKAELETRIEETRTNNQEIIED